MTLEKAFDRRPNRPFPRHSLEEATVIADAIQNNNAGKPMKRLLLAESIGRKPTSIDYRDLLSSSFKYGLTTGTEKAEYIELTGLGKKITKPLSNEQKMEARQNAVLTPEVFKNIYTHYKDAKYPSGQFFENALEVNFKIPREYVKEVQAVLEKNGKYGGIFRDIGGSRYVMFDAQPPEALPADSPESSTPLSQDNELPDSSEKKGLSQRGNEPKPIFIGHGKNMKPVEQLKKLLDQFKVPYKVAIDEPNSGRPISQKVRETMNSCGSAIFIFSTGGEAADNTETTIPNLNVVFELGAASVLYGQKIVICKEDGLTSLPSDFSDLGYIPFEKDNLNKNGADLLKELISLGLLRITTV